MTRKEYEGLCRTYTWACRKLGQNNQDLKTIEAAVSEYERQHPEETQHWADRMAAMDARHEDGHETRRLTREEFEELDNAYQQAYQDFSKMMRKSLPEDWRVAWATVDLEAIESELNEYQAQQLASSEA